MKDLIRIFGIYLACVGSLVAAASDTVLDNGSVRFGSGAEGSVNNQSALKQPFYSSGSWKQLTYGTSAFQQSFAIGGDGTSEWNLNGSLQHYPTLSGLAYDASDVTYTSGNSGYGTLVVTGTIDFSGSTMAIENRYVLGASSNYLKIIRKFIN